MTTQPKVQLGCKFRGKPAGFADTETGTYWEVLPPITGDDARLQAGLLEWPVRRWPRAPANHTRAVSSC